MRLFVFTRHAQSVLNVEDRVNGDPAEPDTVVGPADEVAVLPPVSGG